MARIFGRMIRSHQVVRLVVRWGRTERRRQPVTLLN